MKPARPVRRFRYHCTLVWIWIFTLVSPSVLPVAHPFATAGSQTVFSTTPSKRVTVINPPIESNQGSRAVSSDDRANGDLWTRRLSSINNVETLAPPRERSVVRRCLSYFIPRGDAGRSDDSSWKWGEQKASLLSRLLYSYAAPLLKIASQKSLDQSDTFQLRHDLKMDRCVESLERVYSLIRSTNTRELVERGKDPATIDAQASMLTQALLSHQRQQLAYSGFLRLINTAIQAFPSILVARLLRLLEGGSANPAKTALLTACALIAVLSAKMIAENLYFHNVVKCSTQVRGSLAGLIFDKSLRLPVGGGSSIVKAVTQQGNSTVGGNDAAFGSGAILNLMQSDTSLIEFACLQVHTIWDGPLQILMYTSLLYRFLGPCILWGILVLLVTIPVNSFALRILNRLSKYENEAKDSRTKRTSESINNMKILKLQGWEQKFADDINKYRAEELRQHVSRGLVRAINSAVTNAIPAVVLVVTLTAYMKSGRPLVASTIFTAISLFNQLRFPLFFYPMLIDSLANGRSAMRRIATYLSLNEITPYVRCCPPLLWENKSYGCVEVRDGNFFWPSTSVGSEGNAATDLQPALSNINIQLAPGEVVAVVGTVGSGKSALIKGLLGELNPVPAMIVKQAIYDGAQLQDAQPSHVFTKPTVIVHGNVAYCSQEAWLVKGTIKDAILFGREFDEKRYLAAIRDAGLDNDIVDSLKGTTSEGATSSGLLSHDSNVGEGGSSLSGGQRARVALARALYGDEDTKVFLLDDCLSALDAHVGAMVFERLLKRIRESNAAAVIVTNDPSIPRRCDRVILMGSTPGSTSCSTVVDMGSYDDLIDRGHDLKSISSTELDSSLDPTESRAEVLLELNLNVTRGSIRPQPPIDSWDLNCTSDVICHADPEPQMLMENCPDSMFEVKDKFTRAIYGSNSSSFDLYNENQVVSAQSTMVASAVPTTKSMRLSADETMSLGAVPFATYISYVKSVRKPLLVIAMFSSYFMANGAQLFQQFTVAKWTESAGIGLTSIDNLNYMRSLIGAAWVVSLSLWVRSILTMQVGVRASRFWHSRMISSVFQAPMSFFDVTPSGQLLSRFGKEIETVDRGVPDSIGSTLFCFLQIFMSVGALAGVVSPAMLIPIGMTALLYTRAMALFRPAARALKRVETKTRSPIYTHFGEALRGTEIIRSVPTAQRLWSSDHRSLMDNNLSIFSTIKVLDRWLSTRLETLGNAIVFVTALASVFLTRSGSLKAGSAGWALTQSLAITGLMTWAVRCLTDLETNMMSVVRVQELTNLDSESIFVSAQRSIPEEFSKPGEALAPLFHEKRQSNTALAPLDSASLIQSGWPWRGEINFVNVSMRYSPDSPLVLKGINIYIPAGSTLGVVGRTGSGKSSLAMSLFRLVEIECDGYIEIDGIDIRSVGLSHLRQALAIIPQDPVLFAGTVAYNLDATGNSSPDEMWLALRAASPKLTDLFLKDGGLNSQVSEGGKNLSQGQRQLICLARALLRRSRILVMDEATSSVDPKTDQEVQDTIRREFVEKGVSVITIAHRLDTVMGYDNIAVLGNGQIIEYGSPANLARRRNGELRRLLDADRRNQLKGAARVFN